MPSNTGRFKNHVLQQKTVALSSANLAQDEVNIPVYGDIQSVQIDLSVTAAGTLVTPATIDNAIASITLKDRFGDQKLQNISGVDLDLIERSRGIGRQRTIPSATEDTAKTHTFNIPLNVEAASQDAKLQMVLAPFSVLAASGCTGASVTFRVTIFYYDITGKAVTEKIEKISVPYVSGLNTLWTNLPKGVATEEVYFRVTEANVTSYKFSKDGAKEFDDMTLDYLEGIDEITMVDGHKSTEFKLYNTPFVSSVRTEFNLQANTTGTIEVFLVSQSKMQK